MDKIKFLVMDVDGTLTDGKIYMSANGELFKAFDIKDGCGIKDLLPKFGIIPIIITARESQLLVNRCKELSILECHQGVRDKYAKLQEILIRYNHMQDAKYTLANVAYIGDDILDLKCMQPVLKAGGVIGCPQDAVHEVKQIVNFVCKNKAGCGAVREFIEYIHNKIESTPQKTITSERVKWAIKYILGLDKSTLALGCYEVDNDFFYKVIEYEVNDANHNMYESHLQHIDIQLMISGEEKLYVTDSSRLVALDDYEEENDVMHYLDNGNQSSMVFVPNSCAVLYPNDAHKSEKFINNCKVKKIVGKLRIN